MSRCGEPSKSGLAADVQRLLNEYAYKGPIYQYGDKSICKNCGEGIVYIEGVHFTEDGWMHDRLGKAAIACAGFIAEPGEIR